MQHRLDGPIQREELKRFLRTRRERILPQEVGLLAAGRRRTRGLTREDVAQLAGVSFKWYTLFESGAAAGVSRRFLENVSRVLRLTRTERHHLYNLAGFVDQRDDDPAAPVPEGLRRLVDELTIAPAAIYSAIFDVLHYNPAYDALFCQSTRPPGIEANKLWRLFLDAGYRARWHDWEHVARSATNELRYVNLPHHDSPGFRALLAQLHASPDFTRVWNEGDVDLLAEMARKPRVALDLPGDTEIRGPLPRSASVRFDLVATITQDEPLLIFVAMVPVDADTRHRMEEAVRRHAQAEAIPVALES